MVSSCFSFMCPFSSENLSDHPGIHEDPLPRRLSPYLPTRGDRGLSHDALRHPRRGCVDSAESDICMLKIEVLGDLGPVSARFLVFLCIDLVMFHGFSWTLDDSSSDLVMMA